MHTAVAVGMLMLGGWVLISPPEEDRVGIARQVQSPAAAPAVSPNREPRARNERQTRERGSRTDARRDSPEAQARLQEQQGSRDMPAPTDAVGPEELTESTAPPTSAAPLAHGGNSMGRRSYMRAPTASRGGRSGQQSAYRPTSHGQTGQPGVPQQPTNPAMLTPPNATAQSTEKAFSNYRPPSGVSPYMNLFRRDSGGVVDNYTTLVRPQLDQRYLNNQFGRDISGLERSIQGITAPQFNQPVRRAPQSVATPQYYMSFGQSYLGEEP